MTRNYELVVVLSGQLSKEALTQKLTELQALVERFEGTINHQEDWGKRTLAYEVKGNKEGFYTLFKMEMDGGKVRELDRMLRIREDLLRFIIVREEETVEVAPKAKKAKTVETQKNQEPTAEETAAPVAETPVEAAPVEEPSEADKPEETESTEA